MSTQAKTGGANWFLVVSRGGRRLKTFPLSAGTSTAGRDPTNPVPLREHLADLNELAPHFLDKFCAENGLAAMTLTPDALESLQQHDWPGNVRELWNVIQRCALAAEDRVITRGHVCEHIRREGPR